MNDEERENMMQIESIDEAGDYEEEFPFDNTFVTISYELFGRCEAAAAIKRMHLKEFIQMSLWNSVLEVEQEDITC